MARSDSQFVLSLTIGACIEGQCILVSALRIGKPEKYGTRQDVAYSLVSLEL